MSRMQAESSLEPELRRGRDVANISRPARNHIDAERALAEDRAPLRATYFLTETLFERTMTSATSLSSPRASLRSNFD